jgi:hypothetical protein
MTRGDLDNPDVCFLFGGITSSFRESSRWNGRLMWAGGKTVEGSVLYASLSPSRSKEATGKDKHLVQKDNTNVCNRLCQMQMF